MFASLLKTTRGERGAAAVEFAIVVPLMLMLVFGIIVYGFVFNAKLDLQTQARNAARDAAAAMPASTCGTIEALTAQDPVLGSDTAVTVAGCTGPAFVPCSTANASVTVQLTTNFNNPILLIPAPATLSGQGQFPCEGV